MLQHSVKTTTTIQPPHLRRGTTSCSGTSRSGPDCCSCSCYCAAPKCARRSTPSPRPRQLLALAAPGHVRQQGPPPPSSPSPSAAPTPASCHCRGRLQSKPEQKDKTWGMKTPKFHEISQRRTKCHYVAPNAATQQPRATKDQRQDAPNAACIDHMFVC